MNSEPLARSYGCYPLQTLMNAQKAIQNSQDIKTKALYNGSKIPDNNRLFVGGIPKDRIQDDVLEEMKKETEGVKSVILYPSVNDRSKNRGYAFVEYDDHKMAAAARKKLNNRPFLWGNHEVKVDWAEPEHSVDADTMSKVKILYVRNLSATTTEAQLKEIFSKFNGVVERVKKQKDYAFVHFSTREQADEARNKLNNTNIDGCTIEVTWSKPVKNREEYLHRKGLSLTGRNSTTVQPYPILPPRNSLLLNNVRKSNGTDFISHLPRSVAVRQRLESPLLPYHPANFVINSPPVSLSKSHELTITEVPCYTTAYEPYTTTSSQSEKADTPSPKDMTAVSASDYDYQYIQQPTLQTMRTNAVYSPNPYIIAPQPLLPNAMATPSLGPLMPNQIYYAPTNPYYAPIQTAMTGADFLGYENSLNPMALNAAAFYQGHPVAHVPALPAPVLE